MSTENCCDDPQGQQYLWEVRVGGGGSSPKRNYLVMGSTAGEAYSHAISMYCDDDPNGTIIAYALIVRSKEKVIFLS